MENKQAEGKQKESRKRQGEKGKQEERKVEKWKGRVEGQEEKKKAGGRSPAERLAAPGSSAGTPLETLSRKKQEQR